MNKRNAINKMYENKRTRQLRWTICNYAKWTCDSILHNHTLKLHKG